MIMLTGKREPLDVVLMVLEDAAELEVEVELEPVPSEM